MLCSAHVHEARVGRGLLCELLIILAMRNGRVHCPSAGSLCCIWWMRRPSPFRFDVCELSSLSLCAWRSWHSWKRVAAASDGFVWGVMLESQSYRSSLAALFACSLRAGCALAESCGLPGPVFQVRLMARSLFWRLARASAQANAPILRSAGWRPRRALGG